MKTTIFKIAAMMLLAAGSFGSCGESGETPKETVCNVNNPLTDLPWLKEIVDGIEKDIEYRLQHARIYQCVYKDGIGFLLELCVGCPDFGYVLKNCEGETLCILFGYAGDPCTEFEIDFDSAKIIWEINN